MAPTGAHTGCLFLFTDSNHRVTARLRGTSDSLGQTPRVSFTVGKLEAPKEEVALGFFPQRFPQFPASSILEQVSLGAQDSLLPVGLTCI